MKLHKDFWKGYFLGLSIAGVTCSLLYFPTDITIALHSGMYAAVFSIMFAYYSSQNTIKHAQKGKYKKQIDAIIDKSSKVRI